MYTQLKAKPLPNWREIGLFVNEHQLLRGCEQIIAELHTER